MARIYFNFSVLVLAAAVVVVLCCVVGGKQFPDHLAAMPL